MWRMVTIAGPRKWLLALGALTLSWGVGCVVQDESSPDGCRQGRVVQCECVGGRIGKQICQADGTFDECSCPQPSSNADAGPMANPDGGPVEPVSCAVGTWTFGGESGIGDCYPISSVGFGWTVKVVAAAGGGVVVAANSDTGLVEQVVDASFFELPDGCHGDLELHHEDPGATTDYLTLHATTAGKVSGMVDHFFAYDGDACGQSFDVSGTFAP